MIAEFDSVGRFRKERSRAALSLAERRGHQIFAFDLEEVEGEINQTGAPALGGLLHKLERCHAIRTNTAKFAVEIGDSTLSFARAAAVAGHLAVQSRPARVRSWMAPFSIRADMR
jgi:hypothetical protein